MTKLKKETIEFKVNDKLHGFYVWHNLPETFGLSLKCAVDSWLPRTCFFTSESLCDYVNSKQTGHICITEKEYKLNKKKNGKKLKRTFKK